MVGFLVAAAWSLRLQGLSAIAHTPNKLEVWSSDSILVASGGHGICVWSSLSSHGGGRRALAQGYGALREEDLAAFDGVSK